jgi:RNA:NAD 2'-phosphotransferase (TPT1/KptA family)
MLSLVQELEAFASSHALSDLLRVKDERRPLSTYSKGWQALKTALLIADVSVCAALLKNASDSY